MHYVTFSLAFLLFAGLQQLCGAFSPWAHAPQVPFYGGETSTSKGTREALKEAGVIPDVLDDFDPSVSITLAYPNKHKSVNLGNRLKPKAVKSQPVFTIHVSGIAPTRTTKDNAAYVLVLTDPDATSRTEPVKAQMCHWIATNITAENISKDSLGALTSLPSFEIKIGSGGSGIQELMPYFPPAPPPKTGYHRYVFVLLAPAANDEPSGHLEKPRDRPQWGYGKIGAGVREWAAENDLIAVGANFFYSRHKKQ
ncbi:hypothetical protein N7G274_009624 [Stereocaulon virgatum]|uniref:PEBP-like protein n=1 Tax=Stereocaulon virgatum TaxID=373712 RepID=A0ABR3ZVP8_9LECA